MGRSLILFLRADGFEVVGTGAVIAAVIGLTTLTGGLLTTPEDNGLGDRLGGESMLSRSFWLMPGGSGSLDKLLVLNETSGGFGGSTDLRGTRLLDVLYLEIAVERGKTGVADGDGAVVIE